MTEAEWMDGTDPYELIGSVTRRHRFSERKIRLFAVACCRRVLHLLPQPEAEYGCQKAFESAERRAEDPAAEAAGDPDQLIAALSESSGVFAAAAAAYEAAAELKEAASLAAHAVYAASALTGTGYADTAVMVWSVAGDAGGVNDANTEDAERDFQAGIARDIFGNPFRPAAWDASWATAKVIAFARTIYEEQAFARMPELADALSEAGCRNDEILNHCRRPGQHVRGCWVVDLILGKK